MSKQSFFVTFLVTLSFFITSPALAKRIALVIGNNDYLNVTKLQKAVNDARSVTKVLEKIGFEVIEKVNANRRTFDQQLNHLNTVVNAEDEVVFFYAGHGISVNGRNYLLPIDIPAIIPGHERSVTKEAFAEDEIINILQNKGAKVSILIIDACRNNPFPKEGTRSVGRSVGLGQRDNPPINTFVMYSAGIGQEALDRLSDEDENPNSVFTRRLIPLLQQSGLSHVRMAKTLQVEVEKLALTTKSKHRQFPAFYDQVRGDFYFVPNPKGEGQKKQEQVAVVAPPNIKDPDAKLRGAEALLGLTRDDIDNLRVVAEVDYNVANPGVKSLEDLRGVIKDFNAKKDIPSQQYWSIKTQSLIRSRAIELREKTALRQNNLVKLYRLARALAMQGYLPEKIRDGKHDWDYWEILWGKKIVFKDFNNDGWDWSNSIFSVNFLNAVKKYQTKHSRQHWKGYLDPQSIAELSQVNIKLHIPEFEWTDQWPSQLKKMKNGSYWRFADHSNEDGLDPKLFCAIYIELDSRYNREEVFHPHIRVHPRKYPSKRPDAIIIETATPMITTHEGHLMKSSIVNDYISGNEQADFLSFDFNEFPIYFYSVKASVKILVDKKVVYHGQELVDPEKWQRIVNAFRRGLEGTLQYWSPNTGKIETYQFDLSGFNEAYKYAKSNRCS